MSRTNKFGYIIPVVAFVHGASLMAMLAMLLMSNYEDELYDRLLENFLLPSMSQQESALSLLRGTHNLLKPRQDIFSGGEYSNIRDEFFRSSDIQLIDAQGDCGSYSHVLGRLLQRAGFDVRLTQMKCASKWGCHIFVEASVDGRFVALDALYNLAFIKEDGTLASSTDLAENWDVFQNQVPAGYPHLFSFEDVRYTNWSKIPILLPVAKQVFNVFIGEEVETLSLRSLALNVYKTYLFILMLGYALLLVATVYIVTIGNNSRT